MRKYRGIKLSEEYRIMVVDDEEGIIDSVSALLNRNGYWCAGYTNPLDALKALEEEPFDLVVLDYYMQPMHGDAFVEQIRKTDKELYILLLTGHKDLAPPISTIKSLDIQAYCEKSDRLDQLQLLIESGIKSISQMRMIKQFRDGLNSILGAVPQIYQLQPIGDILEEILKHLLPLMKSKDAFILVDDIWENAHVKEQEQQKSIFCGIGKYDVEIETFTKMLDHESMMDIGRARMNMEVIRRSDGVVIPLARDQGGTIGVIYVASVNISEGIRLLEIYARQAASSINNAFLHSLVNTKNEELKDTYAQLKVRYMDTIEVLRQTVDAKDAYTRGHSDRVSYYACKIGRCYGLGEEEQEQLRIAGLFHDIGKIGMTDDILLKTNKLSPEEYELIKRHPIKGAMILSAVSMFQDVVPIVRHHHERVDGQGYPDGLVGDEIELMARIIGVTDAFDAMMSDRLYRSHLTLAETCEQLKDGVGTQFDEQVVKIFLNLLEEDEELKQYVSEMLTKQVRML
ncbi:MAG: HD domain-containing phosphohydrolase [Christensenellales bacterium]|jgi:putative nucleotidyltransferase with HDIG domain